MVLVVVVMVAVLATAMLVMVVRLLSLTSVVMDEEEEEEGGGFGVKEMGRTATVIRAGLVTIMELVWEDREDREGRVLAAWWGRLV